MVIWQEKYSAHASNENKRGHKQGSNKGSQEKWKWLNLGDASPTRRGRELLCPSQQHGGRGRGRGRCPHIERSSALIYLVVDPVCLHRGSRKLISPLTIFGTEFHTLSSALKFYCLIHHFSLPLFAVCICQDFCTFIISRIFICHIVYIVKFITKIKYNILNLFFLLWIIFFFFNNTLLKLLIDIYIYIYVWTAVFLSYQYLQEHM